MINMMRQMHDGKAGAENQWASGNKLQYICNNSAQLI